MPKGILKNARSDASYKHESPNELDQNKAIFDRQQVIENTRINSKLTHNNSNNNKSEEENEEEAVNQLKELQLKKDRGEKLSEEEQLKWDERNLLINEMEKSATMKIDEPKTPYEGGFDPNNDYYRTDNEDEEEDKNKGGNEEEEDDDFNLGEGVDDEDDVKKGDIEVVNQGRGENENEEEEGDDNKEVELSAEEKHRIFEEKRKQHYHLKAAPLKHHVEEEEDEEEEE